MTKLYFDSNKINNNLLPQLLDSKKKLETLLKDLNSMNIPYDFSYRNYLKNLISKIESYIKKVKYMEDKIEYSNKQNVKLKDDFNFGFSQIEKNDIKIRESLIVNK